MSLLSRYMTSDQHGGPVKVSAIARDLVIGVVALIILSICWPFYSVPTGSRGVVTRFGHITTIQPEGLVILPPWERLTLFSIRAETSGAKDASGGTKDQQEVITSLTVRYNILPDKVGFVFEHYSHNGDLQNYVFTATAEVFKAVTAKFTAPELLSKRAEVSQDVHDALQQKLDTYGATVVNVDMTEFKWADPAYAKSISDKVTQDQLLQYAEKKSLTTQADQQSNVYIAEASAKAVRAKADGDAYATIAAAKADAEQTKLNANAQAESIKVQQAALAAGQQVLELKRIQVEQTKAEKWDGALPVNVYGSAPIPYMSVPLGTKRSEGNN